MLFKRGRRTNVAAYAGAASGLDPATTAWIAAVTAANGAVDPTNTARKTLVDTLIKGLKADGIFAIYDALWMLCFADQNQHEALIDIIGLHAATLVNPDSQTLDANGWTNAVPSVNDYIDTGLTPSTFGGNYALHNGSLCAYSLTSRATSNAYALMGDSDASGATFDYLVGRYSDGHSYLNVSTDVSSNINGANANGQGAYVGSNVSNTGSVYRNGSTTPIVTGALTAGPSLSNQTMLIGARRSAASIVDATSDSIAAAGLGGPLSSAQAVALNNRINTCLANLPTPKNVY